MSILKKTSVTPEPLSAIHFSVANLLPPTVSLAFLMSAVTRTKSAFRSLSSPISNRVVGYSFTLSKNLDPTPLGFWSAQFMSHNSFSVTSWTLSNSVPPWRGAGALPMVEYSGRLRPKGVTFLSLQHSEKLERSLSYYIKYIKGHQSALLSKRDSSWS